MFRAFAHAAMNVASRRGRQDSALPLPKMCHRSLLQMLQSPRELLTRLSSTAEPTFRPLQDTQLGDSAEPAVCAIPCTHHQAGRLSGKFVGLAANPPFLRPHQRLGVRSKEQLMVSLPTRATESLHCRATLVHRRDCTSTV